MSGVERTLVRGVMVLPLTPGLTPQLPLENPDDEPVEGVPKKLLRLLLRFSPPFIHEGEDVELEGTRASDARLLSWVRCVELIQDEEPALLTLRAQW